MIDNTVSLSVDSQLFSGWKSMRFTRGIERMPSDFMLTCTERYPNQTGVMQIKPGQACRLLIGNDIVLTGFIDRVMPSIDPHGHHITVLGRGRCADLVDCSAYANNTQFMNRSVLDIATLVCKPFNIVVSQRDPGAPALPRTQFTADGQVIPLFNVNLTTTAWQIIEEIARYACLLAYETETGDMMLAQVGTAIAASGFASGVNVEAAASMESLDQRYSTYLALNLAVDTTLPLTPGAAPSSATSGNIIKQVNDPNVSRYRPLVIISEQGYQTQDITLRRAIWEMNRRYGRSQAVTIVADDWRDKAGNLWTPNTLATVDIPELHITGVQWLISEVSFVVDPQRGKIAEVSLMPAAAFTTQPPAALYDVPLNTAVQDPTPPPPVSTAKL
jgi:prophage tail gpP-like protein